MPSYSKSTTALQATVEAGYPKYATFNDLTTTNAYQEKVTGNWEAKVKYPKVVIVYNEGSNDGLLKINDGDAIVLPAGILRVFSSEQIAKLEYKSKVTDSASTLHIEVWGRTALEV